MTSSVPYLAIEVICVLSWVFVQCIILPLDIYWFVKFWKHRFSLFIVKRKPRMLLVQLLSLWIGSFIFQTISVPSYFGNGARFIFIGYVQSTVTTPLLITNFAMSASRYWLLFYMIKWNGSMKDNKWQSIINPSTESKDWYLRNRKKYGSWKWLRSRIIIIGFLCYLCIICVFVLQQQIRICNFSVSIWFLYIICAFIAITFTLFIPGYLYYFIYKNIPKLDDEIGLQKELKPTLILFYCFVIMSYLTVCAFFILHSYDEIVAFKIVYQACFVIIRVIFSCCNWRHTQWVLNHFPCILLNESKAMTDDEMHSLVHQKTYIALQDMSSSNKTFGDSSLRTQMRDILMEEKMFDAFMRRLLNEYCSECLLSMIEMLQFKQRICREKLNTHLRQRSIAMGQDNEEKDSDRFLILHEKCPRSVIVYAPNNSDYKTMAIKLYRKYIRIGCTLEINIDYAARLMYRNLFENEQSWRGNIVYEDPKKLYYLFNPCIEHMTSLICASFTRFKQSKEYRMLKAYSPPTGNGVFQIIQQAASLFSDDDDEDYIE